MGLTDAVVLEDQVVVAEVARHAHCVITDRVTVVPEAAAAAREAQVARVEKAVVLLLDYSSSIMERTRRSFSLRSFQEVPVTAVLVVQEDQVEQAVLADQEIQLVLLRSVKVGLVETVELVEPEVPEVTVQQGLLSLFTLFPERLWFQVKLLSIFSLNQ